MYSKEQYIDSDGQLLKIYINHYGTKMYFNDYDEYHRLDGPAMEFVDGSFEWFREDLYHRIGGPAYFDGIEYEWWYSGEKVNYRRLKVAASYRIA